MDRGAWGATVYGVTKELDTTEQLNDFTSADSQGKQSVDILVKTSLHEAWSRGPGEFNPV